ncbi:MAG: exosortase/archaeosortase family protein [Candidatus Acidiferrales bacterium]
MFWTPLVQLVAYALHHDFCSQILVVPFISAYLLYIERRHIFRVTPYAITPGISAILAGLGIGWWAARSFDQSGAHGWLSISALSLVLIWIGAFVTCYGLATARRAAFPLLFLLLMIPPPDFLLSRMVYWLQEGSTEVSAIIFRAFGIPVFRHGFVLAVPGVRIEVAQECSSIRSSIALFITCLLAGHLFLHRTWKTVLLVVLSLPLSVIKNGIRISTLTLLSVYVDPGFLHGRLHRDGGFVFFLIALALIYPVFRFLEKRGRGTTFAAPEAVVGLQRGNINS